MGIMENLVETTTSYRDYMGVILSLCWGYMGKLLYFVGIIRGLYVWTKLGLCGDSGKENGNDYNGLYRV